MYFFDHFSIDQLMLILTYQFKENSKSLWRKQMTGHVFFSFLWIASQFQLSPSWRRTDYTACSNYCDWSGFNFDPSRHYEIVRRPQRRSSLPAVSRDFEIFFSDLESHIDNIHNIFSHIISTLVTELNEESGGSNHRIRIVLNAPGLNYPVHIPFQDVADFNTDMVLNEIERVLNSNETFDKSSDMKVNALSVTLPAMGGYKIGGIQNRTVPDVLTFLSQKRCVIVIHSDYKNNCLLSALAVGIALEETKSKNTKMVVKY